MTLPLELRVAAIAITLLIAFANNAQAVVQTLNLDFGNGASYVGDDGVLSSPGGAYWNKITLAADVPPGSSTAPQFGIPTLLNEFGQPVDLGPDPVYSSLPDVSLVVSNAVATTGVAASAGPLADGIMFDGADGLSILVRELSRATPIDVVVYFTLQPTPPQSPPQINSISTDGIFGPGVSTSASPSGQFPGLEGSSYLRFHDVVAQPTTIGIPLLPGVIIGVPGGGTANIAAMQIRGDFVSVSPEPASMAMTLAAAAGLLALRRSAQAPTASNPVRR